MNPAEILRQAASAHVTLAARDGQILARPVASLTPELKRAIGDKPPSDERIFIRSDQQTRYGDFMQVMNSLQDYGFYSVALVGEDQSTE